MCLVVAVVGAATAAAITVIAVGATAVAALIIAGAAQWRTARPALPARPHILGALFLTMHLPRFVAVKSAPAAFHVHAIGKAVRAKAD